MSLRPIKISSSVLRRGLIAAVLAMAGLNTACSTATVPYSDPDPQETSWYAYQQCLSSLPRTASASACDRVGATNAESSYYYTGMADTNSIGWPQGGLNGLGFPNLQQVGNGPYTNPAIGDSGGQYRGYAAALKLRQSASFSSTSSSGSQLIPVETLDASYHEYLRTRDAQTSQALTEQWLALAASHGSR